MSQLIRLWYLPHRRPAKAQASPRIRAVSPKPSLFAHMQHESRRRVRRKIRHLAPVAAHMRLKNEFTEDEKNHNFMSWLILVGQIGECLTLQNHHNPESYLTFFHTIKQEPMEHRAEDSKSFLRHRIHVDCFFINCVICSWNGQTERSAH